MLGKFTFRKNGVYYQGPFDEAPRLSCVIEKQGKAWFVPTLPDVPGTSLGPFKDRWTAARAYLAHTWDPASRQLDAEVRQKWEAFGWQRTAGYMKPELASAVYDILIAKCKAAPGEKNSFIHAHTDRIHVCTEWRFCGLLGFGGKFRNDWLTYLARLRVDCYPEDACPMTNQIVASTNEALFDLVLRLSTSAPELLQ